MEREDKNVHSRDKCFIHWSIMKVGAGEDCAIEVDHGG